MTSNQDDSTTTTAKILTVETIPAYIQDHLADLKGVIETTEGMEVTAIVGGNVNYAFCIKVGDGKSVFLKQAPEFVAIFGPDGFPLTSERMQREMDVYDEWKTMLAQESTSSSWLGKLMGGGSTTLDKVYLPEIFYFDKSHMVVIMEFLDGYTLLDHILVDENKKQSKEFHDKVANSLGDFMGQTHAKTHFTKVDMERREYLTKHFENREMRDIQLEFVFSKCYKEATDEQRAGLTLTDEFLEQVEILKQQYNGVETVNGTQTHLSLQHGDIHPGSVMVNPNGDAKVIDPEFTVYGPAGLDVGSLLSGYCLGAIHQAYSGNAEAAQGILDGAAAVWKGYSQVLTSNGFDETAIQEIAVESVGFTVAEVCRTALEFAGGRKWLQFPDDAEKKAASKKAALKLVQNCMIDRHTGGMDLLLKELSSAITL
mmetsp:Transcript_30933/g.72618  ORF Transcript_30933/g.72618 Transcript_30933/m.72618 type:complete len:427 (+) Transcript_30933:151-1431(+)